MNISYKKLAYLLLSAALISSDVKASVNDGDFRNIPSDVAKTIFLNAIGRGDLKTLNALALTNHNFNTLIDQITSTFTWKANLVKIVNSKPLNEVSDPLKNYALRAANHLFSQHLQALDLESLKALRSFYPKYVNSQYQTIDNIHSEYFALTKLLGERGEKLEAFKVARVYFLAHNYQEGAHYAKLSQYRAAPNNQRPIQNSNMFLFVDGLVRANDFDGVKEILKNYYATNRTNPFTINEFLNAIPALGQHEAELRKLEK